MIDFGTTKDSPLDGLWISKVAINYLDIQTLKSPVISAGALKDSHCFAV
jgi:hypothetical protein